MAGIKPVSVSLVERRVGYRDVRWIAHDHVVLLAQDAVQFLAVLGFVEVLEFVAEQFVATKSLLHAFMAFALREARAVQEGIARGEVEAEVGGVFDPGDAARPQRRHEQAKAGNGHDVRVEVHAKDLFERASGQHGGIFAGFMGLPEPEQALESAEEEVPGAAGEINHPHGFETKGRDGRRERAVENELLHEHRGLEQGVAFAREFGEVLVEVAEEAGVPFGISEIMDDAPGVGIGLAPEFEQGLGGIGGRPHAPEGIVPAIEEILHARQLPDRLEDVFEVVAFARRGMLAEKEAVLILRPLMSRRVAPGEERHVNEFVVFEEAHEHPGQNPRDGNLGQFLIAPGIVG